MGFARGWLRALVVAAIALGLVATTGIDVAVAGAKRAHERRIAAARAERRAERTLLDRLRTISVDIINTVQPVELAVASAQRPDPAALIGARDAVLHGKVDVALREATSRLHALHAPAAMAADVRALTSSVGALRAAVSSLSAHVGVNDLEKLAEAFSADSSIDLTIAYSRFSDAVDKLFARQRRPAPATSDISSSTAVGWIFGADKACVQTNIELIPAYDMQLNSAAALRRYASRWQHALDHLAGGLSSVPRPPGLPATITARLPLLRFDAKLFADQVTAIRHQDPTAMGVALTKLKEAMPGLGRLGSALGTYGAVGCGNILDTWAGTKPVARKPATLTA